MLVDQENERLCVGLGQSQLLGRLFSDPSPHFAVILDVTLTQVVNQ